MPAESEIVMCADNSKKIILDLCGGTGAWSAPYRAAGYDVRIVTLPASDCRLYEYPGQVYGVLAAPVCTHFSGSGAQYWPQKDSDGRTLAALAVSDACCRIVLVTKPSGFWVLENPVGRLRKWLGPPSMYFDPCDYGDPYTKKTCLWGSFNRPKQNRVEPIKVCSQGSWLMKLGGSSERTKELRSVTPPGFAQAFFEANR